MWEVSTTFMGSIRAGGSMLCWARTPRSNLSTRSRVVSLSKAARFNVGLIQMRSGLSPQANLDAAARLIAEARSANADYVLTPEMTNIMEIKRERLFAAIVPEESDTTLSAFRELSRKLQLFLHIGSLAIKLSAEKAANRSFLIDPE